MNMKRDPMAFLDPQYDLHVAKDANGLNTGSFYVKASPWSHNFLRRVWEHNDGGKGESDQRSFAHVIAQLSDAERAQHVKYYSQKLFNEYPDPIVSFKHWRGHFRRAITFSTSPVPFAASRRVACTQISTYSLAFIASQFTLWQRCKQQASASRFEMGSDARWRSEIHIVLRRRKRVWLDTGPH